MRDSRLPDKDPLPVIGTILQVGADGQEMYVCESEAWAAAIGSCLLWAFDHPAELMRGFVLASLAGASVYAFWPRSRR